MSKNTKQFYIKPLCSYQESSPNYAKQKLILVQKQDGENGRVIQAMKTPVKEERR